MATSSIVIAPLDEQFISAENEQSHQSTEDSGHSISCTTEEYVGSHVHVDNLDVLMKQDSPCSKIPLDSRDGSLYPIAFQVLGIILTYGANYEATGNAYEEIKIFLPMILHCVEQQAPIRMILPAFPFKSPNLIDKTLGLLPDLGEYLALSHLNGLCQNISQIYKYGAKVHITSDGLVYNDILGVRDDTVWEYGEALRQMAVEKELHHLRFIRLSDLLGYHQTTSFEHTKESYANHASTIRQELVDRFGPSDFDPHQAIKDEEDICLTYRGYIKFLRKDLADQVMGMTKRARDKLISHTARTMIFRGKAFAAAIQTQKKGYIRLSIHPSRSGNKLSMSLVPQARGTISHTPWHSCIAVGLDGTYRSAHAEDLRDTHDLVYQDGRPYCFRERSKVFDWSEDGLQVQFDHLYPCGLIIRPDNEADPPSIRSLPMHKVKRLSNTMSPVICRGFRDSREEDVYVQKASELGEILPWRFGIIQKVRDSKDTDKMTNNVISNEAMPMHFDGMFKFQDQTDPVTGKTASVQTPPMYQIFTCQAAAPKGDGYTLFASSRLFFRYLPMPWTVDRLQKVTWSMDNDGYWVASISRLPLVVTHPDTGLPCLRWHQPWDASKTKFSTCDVTIDNEEASLIDQIDTLTYDHRVCVRFAWEAGDILVSDNISMLHARTAYKNDCDRELWRIHCD